MLVSLTVCLLVSLSLTATVPYSDIPKISPLTSNVSADSSYTMETLLPLALTTQSYFIINFSSSNIVTPKGSLNCSYLNQSSKSYVSFSNCSCSNNICTVAPGTAFNQTYNLLIRLNTLTNPTFVSDQNIQITVAINSSTNAFVNTTISYSFYSPNAITLNQLNQSNYGVGSTNVTYSFNFTVGNYIPQQPMLQLSLPDGVGLNVTAFTLLFYGQTVLNNPTQVGNSLIFYLNYSGSNPPTGAVILSITGFINPQYIGQSNSFTIKMNTMACLSGCQISSLSNNIFASSNTAGNLPVNSLYSNDTTINAKTDLLINLQFYAPIPVGGMLQIILPANIKPSIPISCQIINGYTLTDSASPTCSYNQSTNVLSTVNFAYTNLAGPSTAAMSFVIINPSDTTPSTITFQTIDSSGRTIGISQNGYVYTATPGALTATVIRSKNTLDESLTLTIGMILINVVPSNGKVRLLIPIEIANISTNSSPVCRSGITQFACTAGGKGSSVFNISFSPPCTSCTSFNFTISGLKNPSYINPNASPLTLQTVNSDFTGVIDRDTVELEEIPLEIQSYTISYVSVVGTGVVGSQQTVSLSFPLNEYFQTNGGIIQISLPSNSTFVFSIPAATTVSETTTVNVPTTYSLYETNMKSISTLQLSVNCTLIKCGSSIPIVIKGISYSYSSKTYSPYQFNIQTNQHYKISQGGINYPQTLPTPLVESLTVKPIVATTGQTTVYNLSFVPTLPLDSYGNGGYLSVTLPLKSLPSSNCSIITNVSLGFSLNCVMTQSLVRIYFTTGTPQSVKNVYISLIISNVVNTLSTEPLNYTITSYYNSQPSQIFTSKYALTSPAKGAIQSTKSNNTYGVATTLSLLTTFQFDLAANDSLSIVAPVGMFVFTNNQISVNGTLVNVTVIDNTTNLIINFAPFLVASVFNFTLNITNPTSTKSFEPLVISSSRNGFLSQTATAAIKQCLPMTLNITSSTTSKYTGDAVNLTLNFTSNPNSKFVRLTLPVNSWTTSNATLLSQPLTNSSIIPLNSTSTTLLFLNLINRVSLAPLASTLVLDCLDSDQNSVEVTYIPASILAADTPKPIQSFGFRSNSISSNPINLTVSLTGAIYQNNLSTISIYLPQYQFIVGSSPVCEFFNLSTTCKILSSSNNTLTLNYPCSSSECSLLSFNLSISGISNLYPDESPVVITVYSGGYISQLSKTTVTPSIQSSSLTNVQISLSNNTIATLDTLTISFASKLLILSDSVIGIEVQDQKFYKYSDCSYQILNVTYSGCNITESPNGYVTFIALKSLGYNNIQPQTVISISIQLTNAYSAINIKDSFLRLSVSYNNISISTYSTTLGLITNSTTFSPVSFSYFRINRTSSQASAAIRLVIEAGIPITYQKNSTFLLSLPKTQILIPQLHLLNCSNCTAEFKSQDPLFYYYSLRETVCNTTICSQNVRLELSGLYNSNYSYVQSDAVDLRLTYLQSDVCKKQSIKLEQIVPNAAVITATRSNPQAFTLTNISLTIKVNESLPLSTLIKLDPIYQIFYKQIKSIWVSTESIEQTSIQFNSTLLPIDNSVDYVIITLPEITETLLTLTINVMNSPLVPIKGSLLDITIYNSAIIYYKNTQVLIDNEIHPYQLNISLVNSNPIVNSLYDLQIAGSFSLLSLSGYKLFVSTTNGLCGNCSKQSNQTLFTLGQSNSFNLTITNLTNPSDTIPLFYTIIVKSSDYIAYTNSLQVLPTLNPIQFSSNYTLNSSVVSSDTEISLQLINSLASQISITLPLLLASSIKSCYFNSLKVDCTNSKSAKEWTINYQGITMVEGGQFTIQFITSSSSITINDSINIAIKLPKAVSSIPFTTTLQPKKLNATFVSTSYSVSAKSNYILSLQLLNTSLSSPDTTYISIILPFSNPNVSSSSTLSISQNIINMTNFKLNQSITFTNVINPADNRKMKILIQQLSTTTSLVIGQTSIEYQMTQLSPITLRSALRNTSSYNSNIQINLTIVTAVTAGILKVEFPKSQIVYAGKEIKCWTLHSSTLKNVNCQIGDNTNSVVVNESSGWYGTNTLIITGYTNVNFNKAPPESDSIKLNIINSENYTCASLYDIKYLLPQTSTGAFTFYNYSMSSNTKLTPTELSFNFNLQTAVAATNTLVLESDLSYVQTAQLSCSISSTKVPCQFNGNKTQIDVSTLVGLKNGSVEIDGLSVGIQSNSIALYTYDSQNQGYVDSVVFTNPYTYQVLVLAVRVLFPIHTVGYQNFTILVDTYLPKLADHNYCLTLGITGSSTDNSSLLINNLTLNQNLNTTKPICLESSQINSLIFNNIYFPSPSTSSISIKLAANTILVAETSKNIEIMNAPSGFCNNANCDLCSQSSSGQYCFSCREGMVSLNGKCQKQCPSKWYSEGGICQECSFNCKDCFGPFDSQCLSCNPPLIDNSGVCTSICLGGHIENNYCLSHNPCVEGCSLCSPSGFCYECSKHYQGIGECHYTNPLPETLLSYLVVAPAFAYIGVLVFSLIRCDGLISILGSSILVLSITQLFCNVLLIALARSAWSMSLAGIILAFKLVTSIAIYESYFKRMVSNGKQSLLDKTPTHKERFISFIGHFIGVDAYQFYFSKIGQPTYEQTHFGKPIRLFNYINIAPRIILFCYCIYVLTLKGVGDMVYIPLTCMASQVLITLSYLPLNQRVRAAMDAIASKCSRKE